MRRYSELFAYARSIGERIVNSDHRPRTSQAVRLRAAALALLNAPQRDVPHGEDAPRTAAHDALDVLVMSWPDVAAGLVDGDDLMRVRPGLWPRLMTEWPMVDYADLLVEALPRLYRGTGPLLELGSGVGNTTDRLAAMYGDQLVWSDRERGFALQRSRSGTGRVYDFDLAPPDDLGPFELIVATNALHCAADPGRTLSHLRRLLVPNGMLLISEGSSPTRPDGTPWALDLLFQAFDGWWDRGGFRTRLEWCEILTKHGFVDVGSKAMKAGEDDLGGLIWCRSH